MMRTPLWFLFIATSALSQNQTGLHRADHKAEDSCSKFQWREQSLIGEEVAEPSPAGLRYSYCQEACSFELPSGRQAIVDYNSCRARVVDADEDSWTANIEGTSFYEFVDNNQKTIYHPRSGREYKFDRVPPTQNPGLADVPVFSGSNHSALVEWLKPHLAAIRQDEVKAARDGSVLILDSNGSMMSLNSELSKEELIFPGLRLNSFELSRDKKRAYALSVETQKAYVLDLESKKVLSSFSVPQEIMAVQLLDLDEVNNLLVLDGWPKRSNDQTTEFILPIQSDQPLKPELALRQDLARRGDRVVASLPSGHWLVKSMDGPQYAVWDSRTQKKVSQFNSDVRIDPVIFPDGQVTLDFASNETWKSIQPHLTQDRWIDPERVRFLGYAPAFRFYLFDNVLYRSPVAHGHGSVLTRVGELPSHLKNCSATLLNDQYFRFDCGNQSFVFDAQSNQATLVKLKPQRALKAGTKTVFEVVSNDSLDLYELPDRLIHSIPRHGKEQKILSFDPDQNRSVVLMDQSVFITKVHSFCISQRELTPSQVSEATCQLQKGDSFRSAESISKLISWIESRPDRVDTSGTYDVLLRVMSVDSGLAEELIDRYPWLIDLNPTTAQSQCLPRTETMVKLGQQLNNLKMRYSQGAKLQDLNWLKAFRPTFQKMSKTEVDRHLDWMAQSLVNGALSDWRNRGLFASKVYKFASQAVKPIVGQDGKALSDFTFIRSQNTLQPMILGTHPIAGTELKSEDSGFGFHTARLNQILIPESDQASIIQAPRLSPLAWTHAGNSYVANVQIKALPKSDLVPTQESPPYEAMWKDGEFSGLVITGSNVGGDAEGIMDEYLAYFTSEGFKFSPSSAIEDLPQFVEQRIKSGKTDYLIKEAHSDGDEKHLFRAYKTGRLLRGERVVSNGKMESVDLVFPTEETKTHLFSNQDFGEWVRSRQDQPLVYFNTSCWSHSKAVYEVEAARTKNLINIPSKNLVNYFQFRPSNAEYLMFTAFRNQKTYDEIREAMKANPRYKQGTGNGFVFPDEPDYRRLVADLVQQPLDLRIDIQRNREPYNIDQINLD